jgi:hypothetical protein
MFECIRAGYFFTALALGLMYVYMWTPPPQVVVKFPSPYNAGKVIYRDRDHNCVKYRSERVTCPMDQSKVRPQPIMEEFRSSFPKNRRGYSQVDP